MPELGKKYNCYSCHTKFYDLGKPVPLCPKCGADQRDAEEAPLYSTSRSRRVVDEPVEDDDFAPAPESSGGGESEEEEEFAGGADREEEAEEEEEEEY